MKAISKNINLVGEFDLVHGFKTEIYQIWSAKRNKFYYKCKAPFKWNSFRSLTGEERTNKVYEIFQYDFDKYRQAIAQAESYLQQIEKDPTKLPQNNHPAQTGGLFSDGMQSPHLGQNSASGGQAAPMPALEGLSFDDDDIPF